MAPTRTRRTAARTAVSVLATLAAAFGGAGLATPAHAAGTTYYVDSATGSDTNAGTSQGAPWQSLAKVGSTAFQPGDTIAFKGGSSWTGSLTLTSSGTASAPITVTSYGTGRPLIAGQAAVQATVTVSNAHDIRITNLEVTNSSNLEVSKTTDYRGIYVIAEDSGEMPGVVISDNYVHDIDGAATSRIGQGGIAVGVRGNTVPTWYSHLRISGNEVARANAYGISTFTTWCANCEIYPAETLIPTSEVSPTRKAFTDSRFTDNYVHDVSGGGITPQYVDNGLIQGNTVDRAATHRLRPGGGNVGIWWQGTNDMLVQYNTARRTGADGINDDPTDMQGFDADMGTTRSTVQYNLSEDNGGGFFLCIVSANGVDLRYNVSQNDHFRTFSIWSGCSGLRAHNNTVWGSAATVAVHHSDGSTTPAGMEAFVRDTAPYNNLMFDNIFYNPAHARYSCTSNCGYNGTDSAMDYSHNLYWDGSAASTVVPANDPAPLVADPLLTGGGSAVPPTGPVSVAQLRQILAGYTTAPASAARNAGVSTSTAPATDLFGTPVPAGAVDLGAAQHAVTTTASTSLGTSAGTVANVADNDPATSWASADGPALPGDVTLTYGEARTIDAVTVAAAFGQGQGPTSADVRTWDGTAWVTQVSAVPLTWNRNTAAVEQLRIPLPSAVTTSRVQLVVRSANLTWGHAAVYEVRPGYGAAASSGLGVLPGTATGALVDGATATSWASKNSPALPGALQIDPGTAQTVHSIDLSAAFGQGQGPTSVSIEANPGGIWQQVMPATPVTWASNSSTVENRTLTLPTAVTATRFRIVIRAANNTWGHVGLNEVALRS